LRIVYLISNFKISSPLWDVVRDHQGVKQDAGEIHWEFVNHPLPQNAVGIFVRSPDKDPVRESLFRAWISQGLVGLLT
jgi:hypothetical protein